MQAIDMGQVVIDLTAFLKSSFIAAGFSRAVVAVSGGVDSATSCALAVGALGPENVTPMFLPYGELNHQGVTDARLVVESLRIPEANIVEIDIQSLVDSILKLDESVDLVRGGNIMARMRMTLIFDQAKKQQALVVGTENKTEHLLGYFTRFGDEASDIEPLRQLYKTQVYELARRLGLPEPVLTKPPSAGLWEGQTDEGEFGFSYKEADEILALLVDENRSTEEVVAAGFTPGVVERVARRMQENKFKHRLPLISE